MEAKGKTEPKVKTYFKIKVMGNVKVKVTT
jgi:hypothetical protein